MFFAIANFFKRMFASLKDRGDAGFDLRIGLHDLDAWKEEFSFYIESRLRRIDAAMINLYQENSFLRRRLASIEGLDQGRNAAGRNAAGRNAAGPTTHGPPTDPPPATSDPQSQGRIASAFSMVANLPNPDVIIDIQNALDIRSQPVITYKDIMCSVPESTFRSVPLGNAGSVASSESGLSSDWEDDFS